MAILMKSGADLLVMDQNKMTPLHRLAQVFSQCPAESDKYKKVSLGIQRKPQVLIQYIGR